MRLPYPLQVLRRDFSLARKSTEPEQQARRDRYSLILRLWPWFYFNYRFSPSFEQRLAFIAKLRDVNEFREVLLVLLELHYLAGVLSGIRDSQIEEHHFGDMQYTAYALSKAEGATPLAIIDSALDELLYHDFTYSWGAAAPFGQMSSYCCGKSLLYDMKRLLTADS